MGDPDFEEYFVARAQRLRRLAYAMCGDWHEAEDIVQATFIRLYRHWRKVRHESVDAYTRRILTNVFLSGKRKHRREDTTASPPDREAPRERDSADRLDIAAALAELTPRQRAMVVLRFMEDMSITDVAVVLGVAEGTVKSQTARGIQSLRAALPIKETP